LLTRVCGFRAIIAVNQDVDP